MFFPEQRPSQGPPSENPSYEDADEGMFFVDFGPQFGEEIQKVLRYRGAGMLYEIVFWQDGYAF